MLLPIFTHCKLEAGYPWFGQEAATFLCGEMWGGIRKGLLQGGQGQLKPRSQC